MAAAAPIRHKGVAHKQLGRIVMKPLGTAVAADKHGRIAVEGDGTGDA